jgi:RND family efflux transporter MFP subunit
MSIINTIQNTKVNFMNHKKTFIAQLVLMAVISSHSYLANSAQTAKLIKITPAQIKTLAIQTTQIQSANNMTSQRLPGEIVIPVEQSRIISAPQPGLIDHVLVASGQMVRKGQVLAHLSSPELVALQREHLQALSQQRLSQNSFNRDSELYKDGIIAERRYLSSESNHSEINALLAERRQALRLSGMSSQSIQQLESSGRYTNGMDLIAPIDGMVLEQMVTAGQRVDGSVPIYRIGKLNPLWLEIHAPAQILSTVRLGMQVKIAQSSASGKVIAIVPNINKLDQTALIRVLINNKDASLAPGQLVEAEITEVLNKKTNGFSIPKSAIIQMNETKFANQTYVFVQVKEGFEARNIKVLGNNGTQALVEGDFTGDEYIVTNGTSMLKAKMQGIGDE